MKNSMLSYSVGPLLYCPANNKSVAKSVINEEFGNRFSLALCLEDTIPDDLVGEAESLLIEALETIINSSKRKSFFIPKIFIRVRSCEQIEKLYSLLEDAKELITGFILPKFSLENADNYIDAILTVNKTSQNTVYIMPIFESPSLINLKERYNILYELKEKLDNVSNLVLNIRVGGNDLCHMFGFRRHIDESIHNISPIANILSDILTVFGIDYVVSGPVWEYYNGENWDEGLSNELKDDILNGFIGKTIIHPNQIPIVNNAYLVNKTDYEDALSILNWGADKNSLVSCSSTKERMNEYKTHYNWAMKIVLLSDVYGIKE